MARPFLTTLFAVMPALALAGATVPSIPDTPAGHALSGWLEAFNSGDRSTLESFEKAHAPWLSLDVQMQLHGRTGGYDLLSIEQSDPLWIVFRAKERVGSAQIVGRLIVRSYDPGHITLLSLDPASEKSMKGVVDQASGNDRFWPIPDDCKLIRARYRPFMADQRPCCLVAEPRPCAGKRVLGDHADDTSLESMSMVMVHPEVPRDSNGAGLGPRR